MKKLALSLFVLAASGGYVWSQSAGTSAETALSVNGGDTGAAVASTAASEPAPLAATSVREVAMPAPAASVVVPPAALAKASALAIAAPTGSPQMQVAAAVPAPATPATTPELQIAQLSSAPAPVVPAPRPTDQAFNARQAADATMVADAAPVQAATPAQVPGGFVDGSYTGSAADAYYGLVQVQANVQGGKLASVKVLQYPSDRRTSRYINSQALPILQREAVSAQDANVDTVSGATLSSEAFINSLSSALQQARTGVVRS